MEIIIGLAIGAIAGIGLTAYRLKGSAGLMQTLRNVVKPPGNVIQGGGGPGSGGTPK
jgi:hypothetical protein